jgi:hypothetical protein
MRSFFFLLCTGFGTCVNSRYLNLSGQYDSPSAIPLMKCSCPSFVAPSRSAIMPASTHTAFNCAPLNSSVLRAISSKLTSGPVDILREWISRIRARAVSPGSGNSILRSSRPERRSAGSRMSIRFVAAMTWTPNQYTDVDQTC